MAESQLWNRLSAEETECWQLASRMWSHCLTDKRWFTQTWWSSIPGYDTMPGPFSCDSSPMSTFPKHYLFRHHEFVLTYTCFPLTPRHVQDGLHFSRTCARGNIGDWAPVLFMNESRIWTSMTNFSWYGECQWAIPLLECVGTRLVWLASAPSWFGYA